MPRKDTGMWYEVHPTPIKGKDGKNLVYVRPKRGLKLTMRQLEDYCDRRYGLRYSELTRAFDVFIRAAGWFLSEGYRIETPIGSFAPKLSLKRQVTDPAQVKDRDVILEGVEYNPGKIWNKEIGEWLEGFRRYQNPDTQEIPGVVIPQFDEPVTVLVVYCGIRITHSFRKLFHEDRDILMSELPVCDMQVHEIVILASVTVQPY